METGRIVLSGSAGRCARARTSRPRIWEADQHALRDQAQRRAHRAVPAVRHWGAETFHAILARRAAVHFPIAWRSSTAGDGSRTESSRRASIVSRPGSAPSHQEGRRGHDPAPELGRIRRRVLRPGVPGPVWRTRSDPTSGAVRSTTSCASRRAAPSSARRASKSFDYVKISASYVRGCPTSRRSVCSVAPPAPGRVSLDALVENATAVAPPSAHQGANDVMRMAFTSGTTAIPRA